MKTNLFFISIAIGLFASCAKEQISLPLPEERISLNATIENLDTKTTYTINGSTAEFTWSGTETFGRLVRTYDGSSYSTYSALDYTSTTELSSSSGVFSGEAVPDGKVDTQLALYPVNKGNGANVSFPTSGNNFTLTLSETLTYSAADPLKDVVPMVGLLSGDEYTFKPLTGVLAIKATNIPKNANKVTISSTGKALSGTTNKITGITDATYQNSLKSQLYDSANGLPMSWFSTPSTKSYSFSGLAMDQTYTFYFPLPTGTLNDLTITFYKGADALYSVSTNQTITISRGHITPLPLISFPTYKVSVGGTTDSPTGTFYRQNATVFFTVSSSSEPLAKSEYVNSMKYTHDPSAANQNIDTYNFVQSGVTKAGLDNTSGLKYLHYIVAPVTYKGGACSAVPDEAIIAQGAIPFYFLTSADKTRIEHQFAIDAAPNEGSGQNGWTAQAIGTDDGDYHPGSSNLSMIPRTFTLKASDDLQKGNIMLYEFLGRSYLPAGMTISVSQTATGTPVYGTLIGDSVTLYSDTTNPFWPVSDNYFIGGYQYKTDVKTSGESVQNLSATLSANDSYYIVTFSTPYIHLMYFRNNTLNTFACLHTMVGRAAK